MALLRTHMYVFMCRAVVCAYYSYYCTTLLHAAACSLTCTGTSIVTVARQGTAGVLLQALLIAVV